MIDLRSLGTVPRRIAALVLFAGPALAMWVSVPGFDGGPEARETLAAIPGICTYDEFCRDRKLVGRVAEHYGATLPSAAKAGKRSKEERRLYGLYALEAYTVHLDMTADARWREGAFVHAIALKLGVLKNLLFGLVWQTFGGPGEALVHAGVAGLFLLSGCWLFHLTRHA
jgi:hypothetical protein